MDSSGTKVPFASSNDRQVPEELKSLHDYYEKWNKEMSGRWSNLVSEKVREIWGSNPNLKISQCIVFGLGSLDREIQNQHPLTGRQFIDAVAEVEEEDGRSKYPNVARQFIVLCMTMDCIKEAAHPIKTYFQDPLFTELDKAYLRYHGYEVLEGDSGLNMVDSTTLMVNLRVPPNIWDATLKATPAVYAGARFEDIIELKLVQQEGNRRHGIEPKKFDSGPLLEDYMNITNAYSFPGSDPQEYLQVLNSHLRSAAAIGIQLDRAAFVGFAIRVVKTVHKDHQPS